MYSFFLFFSLHVCAHMWSFEMNILFVVFGMESARVRSILIIWLFDLAYCYPVVKLCVLCVCVCCSHVFGFFFLYDFALHSLRSRSVCVWARMCSLLNTLSRTEFPVNSQPKKKWRLFVVVVAAFLLLFLFIPGTKYADDCMYDCYTYRLLVWIRWNHCVFKFQWLLFMYRRY